MTTTAWANAPGLEDLAYVLAMARRARKLSRRELAALLDVAISTVNDWEAGRDAPTLYNLIRWAAVFGLRLVIDGQAHPTSYIAGEGWEQAETRRLMTELRSVRRAQKRKQAEIAAALNVTDVSVLRWERQRRTPQTQQFCGYVRQLGCTIELRAIRKEAETR